MRFDPGTYPGARPDGPVLVWRGATWPVAAELEVPADARRAAVLSTRARRWVVAYGSDASPDRLVDKGLDVRGALLLPAALHGWRTAWEARRSATGAIPLTLAPAANGRLDAWVLGVHPDDLDELDATEFRGTNYDLVVVGDVAVAARWRLPRALAFGPTGRTRALTTPGGTMLDWPDHDQATAVARHADHAGDAVVVEPIGPAVGGWPETPLADLDLFVYGTLQPDGVRWPAVAEHVQVLGPAVTTGTLVATPMGWPAATFGDGGPLHGTLLRPRRGTGAELFATADAIESEGHLFRRVAVRVDGPDGAGWAATYAWHPDRGPAPGEVVADGRWSPT